MKHLCLLFVFLSLVHTAKGRVLITINDDFHDGNLSDNPTWQGDTSAFIINPEAGGILQSNLDSSATHYISTPCSAIDSAEWNITVSFEYSTSSVNYSNFYVAMSHESPATSNQAYYLRMGNTPDNICLFYKENGKSTCLIQGREGLLEAAKSTVNIRLTQYKGRWTLYTQQLTPSLNAEITEVEEGSVEHLKMNQSAYCALSYTCTKTRGKSFYFDNLNITGLEGVEIPPTDTTITPPVEGIDTATIDDLLINEIMYEPLTDQQEYGEIINLSDNILSLHGWRLTTRKKDGSFNSGNRFPENSYIMPYGVAALCEDDVTLRNQFQVEDTACIYACSWPQNFNNEGTTLYLLSPTGAIADSVTYSPSWQHPLVKGNKGVALERIHPDLPSNASTTWMSAASTSNYGTPGYRNSQFTITTTTTTEESIYLSPETFSPDGDGWDDICIIHCNFPEAGYVVNLRIFTPTGLFIAQIADNALSSEEEQFIWDGSTMKGYNAEIGIYALVLEAYHPTTGKRLKKKLPIIVHGR